MLSVDDGDGEANGVARSEEGKNTKQWKIPGKGGGTGSEGLNKWGERLLSFLPSKIERTRKLV